MSPFASLVHGIIPLLLVLSSTAVEAQRPGGPPEATEVTRTASVEEALSTSASDTTLSPAATGSTTSSSSSSLSSSSSSSQSSNDNNAITGAGIGVGIGIGVGLCVVLAGLLWLTLWMRKREKLDTPPPPGTSPYLEVIEEGRVAPLERPGKVYGGGAGVRDSRLGAPSDGRESRMSTRLSLMARSRHVSWWLVGQ